MASESNTSKNEPVVLKLDRSRTERGFKEDESLWKIESDKMAGRLENHVKSLHDGIKEGDQEDLPLLSIAIFGSPGSGKSSLLRTFTNQVREKEIAGLKGDVYSLPVIKPNTVASDDHFLYAFLATALKEDREKKGGRLKDSYQDAPILSPLQQKFQGVSEYLQVINKADHSSEDDPLGRSLEWLERHESGLMLVEKMKEFINQLVNIMTDSKDSSILLMPVSGILLSPKKPAKGLPVMEKIIMEAS